MSRPAPRWLTATTTSLWFRASPSACRYTGPWTSECQRLHIPRIRILATFLRSHLSSWLPLRHMPPSYTSLLLAKAMSPDHRVALAERNPLPTSVFTLATGDFLDKSPCAYWSLRTTTVTRCSRCLTVNAREDTARIGRQAMIHHLSGPSAPSTPTPPPPLSSTLLPACSFLPSARASQCATVRSSMARVTTDVADALREADVEGALSIRLFARRSDCLQPLSICADAG